METRCSSVPHEVIQGLEPGSEDEDTQGVGENRTPKYITTVPEQSLQQLTGADGWAAGFENAVIQEGCVRDSEGL